MYFDLLLRHYITLLLFNKMLKIILILKKENFYSVNVSPGFELFLSLSLSLLLLLFQLKLKFHQNPMLTSRFINLAWIFDTFENSVFSKCQTAFNIVSTCLLYLHPLYHHWMGWVEWKADSLEGTESSKASDWAWRPRSRKATSCRFSGQVHFQEVVLGDAASLRSFPAAAARHPRGCSSEATGAAGPRSRRPRPLWELVNAGTAEQQVDFSQETKLLCGLF